MKPEIKKYFAKLGRKGGRGCSPAKLAALKANAKLPRKRKQVTA
jgi:hypothetical protein